KETSNNGRSNRKSASNSRRFRIAGPNSEISIQRHVRCKFCAVMMFGYFAIHDRDIGFRPGCKASLLAAVAADFGSDGRWKSLGTRWRVGDFLDPGIAMTAGNVAVLALDGIPLARLEVLRMTVEAWSF